MTSNATCVVTLDKGNAAWVNAGGSFITRASSTDNSFEIHTYDGHGEEDGVRFVAWYVVPYVWPNLLKDGYYPPEWVDACGMRSDFSIE